MHILGQVAVFPTPDPRIGRLTELAYNLWWSWHPEAQALFAEIDPQLWELSNHNPVRFLRRVSQRQLDQAAADSAYLTRYAAVMAAFDAYMHPDSTWFARHYPELRNDVMAYFSAEFGLHEALPIYSGGLGVLAGDHCKAASDLGLPFVAVGFLYPQGYFQQRIDGDGRQQAIYEKLDFSDAPATPARAPDGREVMISVDLPGRTIYAKVWRIQVGRVPVFLMDTDVEQNAPADRELAARLYGGDQEIRVAQEVVLGIGGVRTLRALGYSPDSWHMNEGHAAFLQLERIREYVERGLPFSAALWAARVDALFTTHTPVAAGNDAFPFSLMERFFANYWGQLGLDRDRFMELGRYDYPWGSQFSMTVLALRTAGRANGVSRLHGAVARAMWHSLWPDVPIAEVPIDYVTNGVHTDTWLCPEMASLYDRYLGPGWRERIDDPATWRGIYQVPDAELWHQHERSKQQMIQIVRERLTRQLLRVHAPSIEVEGAAEALNPNALTVGFARRFATYKRAALIFRDQERLKRILNDPRRPVQLVFSGKAHPADEPGKALIQFIYQMSRQPEFAGKVVFVEDYDTYLARHITSGVDVWLNTPRKPLEASGTSGQKASLNGVPNCSVLDGWWAEGYDGENGWAISPGPDLPDEGSQDEADALSLYRILEEQVVPLFYTHNEAGVPSGWVQVMRHAIATIAPQFSLTRMLTEYATHYYIPAVAAGHETEKDDFAAARELADWEERVRTGWPAVTLKATVPANGDLHVGQSLRAEASLEPGNLNAADLAVEFVYGRPKDGDLQDAVALPMRLAEVDGACCRYQADFAAPESGLFAYGVRARPQHPGLPTPFTLPIVRWA